MCIRAQVLVRRCDCVWEGAVIIDSGSRRSRIDRPEMTGTYQLWGKVKVDRGLGVAAVRQTATTPLQRLREVECDCSIVEGHCRSITQFNRSTVRRELCKNSQREKDGKNTYSWV